VTTETRLLPRDEWHRLVGTEAEAAWPVFPEGTQVIVVEHDGVIVGCWSLLPVFHAECVWIAPDKRASGSVSRRLWQRMHALAREMGLKAFATSAMDDRIRHLLERHGASELPGRHFVVPVKESPSCRFHYSH